MPLDTRLPLLVKTPQPISIADAAANGFKLRAMKRGEDQANQAQRAQKTIQDLYQQSIGADGSIDSATFERGVAQAGLGDQLPEIQKARLSNDKTRADTQSSQFKLAKERADALAGSLGSLLANPQVSHQEVYAQLNNLVNSGVISPEQGAAAARGLPGKPDQLRPFLVQQALSAADASKRLEALLPKTREQNRGGTIVEQKVDPLTGDVTDVREITKTVSPDSAATNARIAAAGSGSDFTPDEGSLMGALAERGISLPAGMRSRAQMKATFASLLSRNPDLSPDDIAEKVATGQINMGAERKETTTAAGVAGRVAVAVHELNTFGDLVQQASDAIPRGKFIPVNRLIQMTDQQLSDPALINLKVQMQSLNNAYDALAARGGTDAEKRAHIAQLFNTAASPEGVRALVAAVKAEAKAAEEAARAATKRRPKETEQAKGSGTGASDVPDDIAYLLNKHGGG